MKLNKTQKTILAVLAGHICPSHVQHSSGGYKRIYQQALEQLEEKELVFQDHDGAYQISEEYRNLYSTAGY